jgi:hypothetical protein
MAITTTDGNYILDAIATGNVDLIKGIAETTELTVDQIKAMLFAGSLEVATTMVNNLPAGSELFAEVAKRAVEAAELEMGKTVSFADAEGNLLDPFIVNSENCGEAVETPQEAGERYAMDNIAGLALGINLDGLDLAAVTLEDAIKAIQMALVTNANTPLEVVTPYLTNVNDSLRAAAFVHPNTDNSEIVAVMTSEDEAGNNIDGFKTAMIELLNTDVMIQGNAEIVAYLLGEGQNAPVRYAMFKNYVTVVLNGGSTIDGLNIDALVTAFVK